MPAGPSRQKRTLGASGSVPSLTSLLFGVGTNGAPRTPSGQRIAVRSPSAPARAMAWHRPGKRERPSERRLMLRRALRSPIPYRTRTARSRARCRRVRAADLGRISSGISLLCAITVPAPERQACVVDARQRLERLTETHRFKVLAHCLFGSAPLFRFDPAPKPTSGQPNRQERTRNDNRTTSR